MGCNYYIKNTRYHIGKSSAGWCFSLHIDPSNGINNLDDVLKLIGRKKIVDEYGETISKKELIRSITARGWTERKFPYKCSFDNREYSKEEFLKMNGAEEGSNNLFRHKIGDFCIGHGEGTWDYLVGEFS
jgi:hypothetical protein